MRFPPRDGSEASEEIYRDDRVEIALFSRRAANCAYLCERQLLGVGPALADALLDDAHCELLVGHALRLVAVVHLVGRQVRVDAVQQQLEALGRVAEASERKSAAREWTARQGAPQRFRAQRWLGTRLQLLEQLLFSGKGEDKEID